ncbi:bifunctional diguanylate cyclase/phosphodiesterase [Oceanospirillum beijerinckii]|uniref:bifunctional diguanylate cyclase/phosphodiesterase n=1 Tax=Oceanospirillum beijerinckii TaxID=64976 RepID=UPI0004145190|nr:EAL domain-containing protein [Oceanospirillum beijerinckii]
MSLLRKNIWTLFGMLILGGFGFLLLVSYLKWQSLNDDYRKQQHNLVELVSSASYSLFVHQEMVLDILGRELIRPDGSAINRADDQAFKKILHLNPDLVGVGLLTPQGEITYISTDTPLHLLPNMLEQETTRDSFIHAVNSDKMVLGRTYFMSGLNEWLIPVRKAIRDETGEVIAVVAAGFRIKGSSRFFSDKLHLGEYNQVSLIRGFDRYIQFRSTDQDDFQRLYSLSVEPIYKKVLQQLEQNYGLTPEQIKASEQAYDFEVFYNDKVSQGVAKYDSRYELWVLSEIEQSQVVADFTKVVLIYLVLFISSQFVLYLLFRIIANAEKKRRQALIYQATHDELTGLPNRGYLQQNIDQWIRPDAPAFSVLYIDMDHFKSVNDSLGHGFGDHVLKELTRRLTAVTPDDVVLVRQGGDEFIALNPCINDAHLQEQSQMIIDSLSRPYEVNGISFTLGVSIGIAQYPEHGDNLDQLLRAADIAMYEAKKYRNSVCFFACTMQDDYLHKVVMEQELRQGLESNELHMVYQPQVTQDGQVFGVEALVRWNNKRLGFVPPDEFISVAENAGLMPALGEFITLTALREIKALQQKLDCKLDLSINISLRQFMQPNFLTQLQDCLAETDMSPDRITLEITESLFIEDLGYILPLLSQVHEMGCHISMDDFGTGFSSLSMLRTLPMDELKIDKSFVDTLCANEADQKLVQNIIAIGKNYGMTVLAEGVETEHQAEMLRRFGCDRFQGYLFSRPLPLDELEVFIFNHFEPVTD